MKLCVNLIWPCKIICSMILIQNMFIDWILGQKGWKSCLWKIWVEFMYFWKTFKLILMHFIHEISWFECFLHKTSSVFQKFHFSRFSIDRGCFSTNWKCVKIFGLNLPDSIGIWSMLNRSKLNFFWFLSFWIFFSMHHLCLGFTCIALFFCIHLAVLQSYFSLFSLITCIHFAKLGTQLDLKIDWLIFESFLHFSICNFLCVNYRKYFS